MKYLSLAKIDVNGKEVDNSYEDNLDQNVEDLGFNDISVINMLLEKNGFNV